MGVSEVESLDSERVQETERLKFELERANQDLDEQIGETSSLYEQLSALYHLFGLFGSASDSEGVPREALKFCTETLSATKAFIALLVGERVKITQHIGLPAEGPWGFPLSENEGVFNYCREKQRTVIVNDFESDPRMSSAYCKTLALNRVICAPLNLSGRVVGFILVADMEDGQEFKAGQGNLIDSISHPLANVIENARLRREEIEKRLMERELDIAQKIQQRLLPESPADLPGLDIDGRTLSARIIGGDYFDFFRLDQGRLAVVLGDAVGKGVSAGLLMTMVKGILNALPLDVYTPSQVLKNINLAFLKMELSERFITMVYFVCDVSKRTILLGNAGHEPPLVFRRSLGFVESLNETSLPIGVDAQAEYAEREILLAEGDALLVYSDGLSEARDARGLEFGVDGIKETMRGCSQASAVSMGDELFRAVQEYSGQSVQNDDMTSVLVKAVMTDAQSSSGVGLRAHEVCQ